MQPPQLIFLGHTEKYSSTKVIEGIEKLNLLGVSSIIASYIFPINITQGGFVFAAYLQGEQLPNYHVFIQDNEGLEVGNINFEWMASSQQQSQIESDYLPSPKNLISGAPTTLPKRTMFEGWNIFTTPCFPDFVFNQPGSYTFTVKHEGQIYPIGTLFISHVMSPPLTPEQIQAIKSQPSSIKAVRVRYECKFCKDGIGVYSSIERNVNKETAEWIWFSDIPEIYKCKCGQFNPNLSYVKNYLYCLLGRKNSLKLGASIFETFERDHLNSIRRKFKELIDLDLKEEIFQKFIQDNPVLLHQFTPVSIWNKAPVLNRYKTDFAILTPTSQLTLIEIEKPNTQLLKKSGGMHSELQHAFDQARSWLAIADEHRLAVLEGMGIEVSKVGGINAVVIAGRDKYDKKSLKQLKSDDYGRVKVMTYDDLLHAFDTLLSSLNQT